MTRLRPTGNKPPATTALQMRLDNTAAGFLNMDREKGNGGKQVLVRLLLYFFHARPASRFTTLDEYLEYRRADLAMP